jgi:hypothetical protein
MSNDDKFSANEAVWLDALDRAFINRRNVWIGERDRLPTKRDMRPLIRLIEDAIPGEAGRNLAGLLDGSNIYYEYRLTAVNDKRGHQRHIAEHDSARRSVAVYEYLELGLSVNAAVSEVALEQKCDDRTIMRAWSAFRRYFKPVSDTDS